MEMIDQVRAALADYDGCSCDVCDQCHDARNKIIWNSIFWLRGMLTKIERLKMVVDNQARRIAVLQPWADKGTDEHTIGFKELKDQANALARVNETLREALGKHGKHIEDCVYWRRCMPGHCTCGLDAALRSGKGERGSMKYRIVFYVGDQPCNMEDAVFEDRAEAEKEIVHLSLLQPGNRYEIEEVRSGAGEGKA